MHTNGGDPEGPAKDTYFLPSWLSGKVLEPCMVIIQLFHHYGVDYYKNHWQISLLICTSFLRVWPCIMMLLSNFFADDREELRRDTIHFLQLLKGFYVTSFNLH